MKKYLKILMVFFVVTMVVMPSAEAWKWTTHSKIVDKTYYTMPSSIRSHLSLSAMRDGSNDPDEKFHDTRCTAIPQVITGQAHG